MTLPGAPTGGTGHPDGVPPYRLLDRQTLAMARLDERERIAMDLHDGVMQSLYALGLGLAMRERALPGPDGSARDALSAAAAQVDAVIGQMQACVAALSPRERAAPRLSVALAGIVTEMGARDLLQTTLRLEAEVDDLVDAATAEHIMYVAREAVSNALRHARASAVALRVRRVPGGFVLTVSDDGVGFDPPVSGSPLVAGHGLRNMRARAERIGGALTIRSRVGRGTRVRLELGADPGQAWAGHAA